MKTFKQIVHGLSKIVGGIAVIVFFFSPFTNTGLTVMAISILVGIACMPVFAWSAPDDEPETPNEDGGYRSVDSLPSLVIATRRPDGTPSRATCPLCKMVFSTEAFNLDATFPHERKLNEWYTEHLKTVHAAR